MKKIFTLLLVLVTTGGVAQVKLRHGLVLGGGQGFVSGAQADINPDVWGGTVEISGILTDYQYNALLGYKLRIQPSNGKAFYDIDASISFKNIEYSIPSEIILSSGEQFMSIIPIRKKTNFYTSLSLTYNYRTYKGLYVGAGIAPVYCNDPNPDASNRFDVPPVVKAGYDLGFVDLSFSYKFGVVNLMKDRHLTSGRINDWQIQLFIPF